MATLAPSPAPQIDTSLPKPSVRPSIKRKRKTFRSKVVIQSLLPDEILARDWNAHDIDNFAPDYKGSSQQIQTEWDTTFASDVPRSTIYAADKADYGSFLPLNNPSPFIEQLEKAATLTPQELHISTQNSHLALHALQDEWIANQKLLEAAERNEKRTANPRQLEDAKFFQDQLEADIYGYKYSKKAADLDPKLGAPNQDPWSQGGFVPKATKKVANAAAAEKGQRAVDDSSYTKIEGQSLVPWAHPKLTPVNIPTDLPPKAAAQKAEQQKGKRKAGLITGNDTSRPSSAGSTDATAAKAGTASAKRETRFRGAKVPNTRETSEAPLLGPGRSPRPRSSRITSAAPSRSSTPGGEGSPSPSKRRKAAPGPSSLATTTTAPAAASATATPKTNHDGLTDDSLKAKITTEGALFLYPTNAAKADEWGRKLLETKNPLRSLAMYKKWDQWEKEGKNKRPRKKDLVGQLPASSSQNTPLPTIEVDDEAAGLEEEEDVEDEAEVEGSPTPSRPRRSPRKSSQ